MKLKTIKIFSVVFIFLFSFLSHFMYDLFPSTFISFFFPVNESIWEHMKILYSSILIWGIIENVLLKIFKVKYNNFMLQLFISAISSIIIYLIIFLPIFNLFGENLIFSITLMFIVYVIAEIISYNIMTYQECNLLNIFAIIFIIWGYVIFIYLTYKPFNNYIFYDTLKNDYGIIKENN